MDLDHLFASVHLNPVSAGIVEDLIDYPQSGHGELLGATAPRLCDVQAALAFFDEDVTTARSVSTCHVRAVAEARWLSTGVRRLRWWQTVQEDDETVPRNLAPRGSTDSLGQPLAPEQHARPKLVDVLAMARPNSGSPAARCQEAVEPAFSPGIDASSRPSPSPGSGPRARRSSRSSTREEARSAAGSPMSWFCKGRPQSSWTPSIGWRQVPLDSGRMPNSFSRAHPVSWTDFENYAVSGRPGRLPAQAPHRSGRAGLPHLMLAPT